MERLTKRISKTIQDKYSLGSYLTYDFANADDTNKLLNKLGVFEDLMEEQGFKDLQSLKDTLYQTNMELYSMIKLQKENQALKDRWQRLKESILEFKNRDDTTDDDTAGLWFVIDKMQELEGEDGKGDGV